MQKQMYKVLCPIERKDGGTFWMRVGTGFRNKDDSMNIYLDAMPTKLTHLQIREVDEEDLRRREAARQNHTTPHASGATGGSGGTGVDAVPF